MKSLSRVSTLKKIGAWTTAIIFAALSPLQAQTITITTSNTVTLPVSSAVVRDHVTNPILFGFNVPWDSVQGGTAPSYADGSNLWNSTTQQIQPDLADYLQTDFVGALYRYPGGTTANYFDWDKTIGSVRQPILPATGWPARAALFGVDEFLRFVESVKGNALLQVNMYSINGVPITTDAQWTALKQSAVGWLEYCNAPVSQDWNGDGTFQGQWRANNGHSAPYHVTLWELGNELDTASTYTKELYASRCQELIAAMSAVQPQIAFLAHARTAPWSDSNWTAWHNSLLATVGATLSGIAWHPYYDGCNVPYMNQFTNRIGVDSSTWAAATGDSTAPGVSLTEYGKWPASLNDSTTWPDCTTLSAAVGVVDMVISHQYRPSVQMALNHALACDSPWAQFSQVDATTHTYLRNSVFTPRPTAYALKLMNRLLGQADLLTSTVVTPRASGYDYDVRAVGLKYGASNIQGAVLINRATSSFYPVTLTLPGCAAGNHILRMDGIGGPDGTDALWKRYMAVAANSAGQTAFKLPALTALVVQDLGLDLMVNGNFEQGTVGYVPANWEKRVDTGVTASAALVTDTSGSVNGNNIVRLQKTAGSGSVYLVQPAWSNAALTNSGSVSKSPYNTHVLRANIRTASLSTNAVRMKVQCFDASGNYLSASPTSGAVGGDSAGKWLPLEMEFVPATLFANANFGRIEIVVSNASGTGCADLDGVTLQQRKNWVVSPLMQDANGNGVADDWENRIESGAGTITFVGSETPTYVRIAKTGSGTIQFAQCSTANSALGSSGALNARKHEKWRLKARLRYSGLDSNGVQLKMQCFDNAGAYRTNSPTSIKLTGTNTAWTEAVLEFNLRDIFGTTPFGRAEIMIQSSSTTGYADVCFMGLEAVD